MRTLALRLSILVLILTAVDLSAQDADLLTRAQDLYTQDSFEKAFALVAEGLPETSTDTGLKTSAGEWLASVGAQEYALKNYKNAYDAYRKALKYAPTNAQASQGFLKIRRERDVTALKNEGAPRKAATAADAPGTTAAAAPASSVTDAELSELKSALQDAGTRLKTMESSVSNTSQENEVLKAQVDQQLKLLQTFIEKQSAPAPRASTTAAPASTTQERALIAQTVELLARLADKESAPVVVQSDPELKALVSRFEEGQKQADNQSMLNGVLIVALLIIGVILLGLFVFFLVAALRAHQRGRRAADEGEPNRIKLAPAQAANFEAIGSPTNPDTPLLEYHDSNEGREDRAKDFAIRKDLMKAERLGRMQQEVRNGTLSWNTIRGYIGDMEVSLKAEILKVVEQKLHEGDLLSSEAILPVLFPFLTDYDNFIKEKAERLARTALEDTRKKDSTSPLDEGEASDPLSLKNLLKIPQDLQALFKNQDQSLVTAKLCRGIGITLGLSTAECNLLYKTGLAHDCGYLMLDRDQVQRIIAKPEISEEEFTYIQSHVLKGPGYFGEIDLPEEFRAGLLYHHERNDGSGYPDGLKKDHIPLFAKIIGVAETFAALVSKRSYRDKRDLQHAMVILADGSRTKFDAAIVEALSKVAPSLRNP